MTTTSPSTTPTPTRHRSTGTELRGPSRHAAQRAVDANSSHIHFTIEGTTVDITLPPVDKLAFYAGLGAAAAVGVIEWPIALVTGLGHLLADDRRNRTVRALGEALDAV